MTINLAEHLTEKKCEEKAGWNSNRREKQERTVHNLVEYRSCLAITKVKVPQPGKSIELPFTANQDIHCFETRRTWSAVAIDLRDGKRALRAQR